MHPCCCVKESYKVSQAFICLIVYSFALDDLPIFPFHWLAGIPWEDFGSFGPKKSVPCSQLLRVVTAMPDLPVMDL